MMVQQFLIAAFAAVMLGLFVPLGHAVRSSLFRLLIALVVPTLIGRRDGLFPEFLPLKPKNAPRRRGKAHFGYIASRGAKRTEACAV